MDQVEAKLDELRPQRAKTGEFMWALDLREWLEGACALPPRQVQRKAAAIGLDWPMEAA